MMRLEQKSYFYVPINNLMCNGETSGAKYRCQCAFNTICNQNYKTLIFKNTLCVIYSRINKLKSKI